MKERNGDLKKNAGGNANVDVGKYTIVNEVILYAYTDYIRIV